VILLKIVRVALKMEDEAASRDRLGRLEMELAALEEKSNGMTAAWKAEKDSMAEATKIKERLEQARTEAEVAQRKGDLARASQLLYGEVPELERKLAVAADKEGRLVHEAVTEESIAQVVARWTGACWPVSARNCWRWRHPCAAGLLDRRTR
jgi:ATP-dependent Clp protease ATP-binding subunit ClpB